MASIPQIRGALLEEAILFLLEKVGYTIIEFDPSQPPEETGLNGGHSGLEVRGRGTWHQIDALVSFDQSPAFMYPLRLMVEAKCYQERRPVGIEVARNAVGVLKDISENYFTVPDRRGSSVQVPRYNYHSAIFSTSGFTSGAVEYSLAHQVFLIQYENVPVIQPLIDAIMDFDESCVTSTRKRVLSEIRRLYRNALRDRVYQIDSPNLITDIGLDLIEKSMVRSVRRIEGSYFGMLQGRWPMHLLTSTPLPAQAFQSDTIECRLTGYESGEWKFTPLNFRPNHPQWFELQFHLPEAIAVLVSENWGDREAVADIKQQHFSYINLSGKIGGIKRNIRLEMDRDWINNYLDRIRRT
jgi:hypothetical protein